MIRELLPVLGRGTGLEHHQIRGAMAEMLSGAVPDSEAAEFLSGLAERGETDEELLGMLETMMEFATRVHDVDLDRAIDMCGTGGDGLGTFNISTAASFVVAAAGGMVAKHGNRSSSGASGSADVFEYLGYDLNMGPSAVLQILQKHGIAFMFAQRYHSAMRHVAAARRRISGRTAFNLLGPLSNPAGVRNQLVGVSDVGLLQRIPRILERNGARTVMTVCSGGLMDELSTSSAGTACLLRDGRTTTFSVLPEMLGLHRCDISELQIKSKQDAMESFISVLKGTASRAMIETVALNAAGGLVVGGVAADFGNGLEMALDAIHGGRTARLLKRYTSDVAGIHGAGGLA